jgi:hypothetical protein
VLDRNWDTVFQRRRLTLTLYCRDVELELNWCATEILGGISYPNAGGSPALKIGEVWNWDWTLVLLDPCIGVKCPLGKGYSDTRCAFSWE